MKAVKGNIAALGFPVHAIVNAANEELRFGSGVAGAIWEKVRNKAGMQRACQEQAPCPTGQARLTGSFGIPNVQYVIHAVGPDVDEIGGLKRARPLLRSAYRAVMLIVKENKFPSVAIPILSAGVFGYPPKESIQAGIKVVREFSDLDVTVYFVAFGDEMYGLLHAALAN